VRLHDFQLVHSHKEFIDLFMAALDANEEGYMAKDPFSVYEFKRTKSWWKMKDEIEADGEIIGFKPGKEDSAFAHTLGSVTIRLENGVEVEASGIKHVPG
jgi:DNA ligase-1